MIKKILYIIVLLVVCSCQSVEKAPKPNRLIKKDQMIEILTDIAFVKATKGGYKKKLQQKNINLEDYVLEKHGVDSVTFAENNKWYANQLDEYHDIFSAVKANIQKEKTKYEKLKREEDSIKKIQDSIKRAKKDKVDKDLDSIENEEMEEDIEAAIEKAVKKRSNHPHDSENE